MRELAMLAVLIAAFCAGLSQGPARAQAAPPIAIVAAENFYGDVAKQIGGPHVEVTSILANPDQDPHLFEASASVARAMSAARIVVYNGVGYDPWMEKLLSVAQKADRKTIVVAALIGRKTGDNPHIWYDLAAMRAFARALADDLSGTDPAHKPDYQSRLGDFQRSLQPIEAKIKALRARLAGTPMTATEPVLGYMIEALGMVSRNQKFQLAVMNGTEPGASDVAGFEDDLKHHLVKLLVYNSQATDPVATRMLKLAKQQNIPVLGVTETEPPGTTYQAWMASVVEAVDRALPQ